MGMTMEAQEMQREYKRQYRERNRDRINAQQRAWNAKNADKIKEYQARYWQKKAETGSIRLPWLAYGITEERYNELLEVARSGQHDTAVLSAALKADRQAISSCQWWMVCPTSIWNIMKNWDGVRLDGRIFMVRGGCSFTIWIVP